MSKPFQLLKTFTEKELTNFQKLLDSGYITTNERLGKLLKILKRQALLHDNFTPEILCTTYKALFGEKNIENILTESQAKKLNREMNDLLKSAEKFLMFEKIKGTDEHDTTLLFPELIDRKQLLLYNIRVKAAEKKLDKEKKRGARYYTEYYNIQHERSRLLYLTNSVEKEDNYNDLQYYLDVKYILEKLNLHLVKITALNIFSNKNFDLSPFNALKNFFNLPQYFANPLIRLSLLNIDLIEMNNDSTFNALLNEITNKTNDVPASYLKPFYTNLTNYCVRQEVRGRIEFAYYLFEIYNNMHEKNLLLSANAIDAKLLKNIITYACRANKYDWAKAKLDFYRGYVPKPIRNDIFNYNSSIIAFNQQKYVHALDLLVKVRKIDHIHDLGLRIVQLQCYYETDFGYEANMQQMINSLKAFISGNKKLVDRQKRAYLNFIFIFNKLYKFKDIPDKRSRKKSVYKTLPKIKKRLLQYELIREKKWLLSKIETLENV